MFLSDLSIRNRTAVGVLTVLIAAVGVYSYLALPREAFPDVQISMVVVSTVREGVAPADMESSVTMKIEKKLAGLSGIKEIRSSSAEGMSLITIEFLPEVKIDDALQRVRDKVSQAKMDLPSDLKSDPTTTEISFSDFPIMMVNMSGPVSPATMKIIADALKDRIEIIPGVMSCNVMGALEREIRLEIDPDRLSAYGLTIPEVLGMIPGENVNISAGGMETAGVKFNVRTPAEFKNPEDAIHVPLTSRHGKTIYLDDIAVIADTFKDRATYSRVNGKDSVTLSIQKRAGGNIIEIADTVRAVLAEGKKQVPAGVDFDVTYDLSKRTRRMVADLENHILSGLVLVLAVLMVFLGWRASVIVALAIPLSLMISFGILLWMGYTLNMIVLFSLIMVLGMLVDDAIVVVENIWRHRQMGEGKIEAAMKGTSEVAMPVLTSTATKIAAFFPMAFWPGMMGSFMKYLPITLVVTLSSSLFVAMIINPTVAAMFGGHVHLRKREPFLLRGYRAMMLLVMKHRVTALALTVLLLAAMVTLYGKFGHGVIFFPQADPEQAIVNVRCPQGTHINETNRLSALLEKEVDAVWKQAKYQGTLDFMVSNVGSEGGNMFMGGASGPHVGNITLMFRDFEQRTGSSADFVADLRARVGDITGGEVKIEKQKNGPQTGAPVTVQFIGKDFDELARLSQKAYGRIQGVPNLVNLRNDYEATRPELAFRTDRTRAAMLGLNSNVIGNYLRTALWGTKVGTYRELNDEYDITVRLPGDRRTDIDDIFQRSVPGPGGSAVPLSSLGTFDYQGGMGTINRLNQKRVVTLTADNEGRQPDEVLKDVMALLDPLGPTMLTAADVLDWKTLLADMTGHENPQSREKMKLGWEFRSDELQILQTAYAEPSLSDPSKGKVLAILNASIARKDFATGGTFQGKPMLESLPFDEQGKELMSKGVANLSSKEIQRLNRLALEAMYPKSILAGTRIELPPGYEIRFAGEREEQEKAMAFLGKAFIMALLLIFLVLVAEFNTLSVPFIIMSTVVLSMIGVLIGLLVAGLPFSVIMTGVGAISLTGVVVANGIVLLDFVRALQRRGMSVVDAAIQASVVRLRPVFLTAITAILGLLPMATGVSFDFHHLTWSLRSESSQFWASMAIAVIYGLTFATVLTLVIVPALYVMIYRQLAKAGLGGLHKVGTEEEAAPITLPPPIPKA